MKLFAATFGPSQSVDQPDHWLTRAIGGGRTNAGPIVSAYTALQLPVVYACVNRIANPLSGFPIRIMKPKTGGGSQVVTDHPLSQRIGARPNDLMSSRTLRKTGMVHALLHGNGYVEIERNNIGQAAGLWPLLPWDTNPVKANGSLSYDTSIGGKRFNIDQGDVLHIMDMSQDGYRGMSPIGLAREALGMAKAMEEFGGKFFANDAKSGGFLMHPGKLGVAARDNLGGRRTDSTNPASPLEKQSGLDNAHRVKVLEEGMKFVPTTIPPEDAQFLGSRQFQIAEIARMYDVPLILLQSHDGNTSWGTGIEQLMIGFVRQTVAPWVGAWEQEMNWKLFTQAERDQGYFVKFNMNAYMRGDAAARSAYYKDMFSVGGFSPNRILTLEDEDPIGPSGDHHFVPSNYTTIERAITPPPPPPGAAVTETIRESE